MHDPSKKILSSIFLALIVFLFNVYDYDVCSPINQVCPQDIICIELALRLEKPDISPIHNNSPFKNLNQESSSFISKLSLNSGTNLFRFRGSSETNNIIHRHLDFPANHITSILQKFICHYYLYF